MEQQQQPARQPLPPQPQPHGTPTPAVPEEAGDFAAIAPSNAGHLDAADGGQLKNKKGKSTMISSEGAGSSEAKVDNKELDANNNKKIVIAVGRKGTWLVIAI